MRERRRAALNSPYNPLLSLSRPPTMLLNLSPLLSLLSPPIPLLSPSSLILNLPCSPPPLYPPLNRITRLFVCDTKHLAFSKHGILFLPNTKYLTCITQTQQINETHYQASLTSSLPPTDPLRRLLSPRLPSLSRRLINRMLRCAPWRISRPPKLRPPLPPLLRVMHRSSRNGGIFWPTPHAPAQSAPLSSSRSYRSRAIGRLDSLMKLTATPVLPARPVRPMRCT